MALVGSVCALTVLPAAPVAAAPQPADRRLGRQPHWQGGNDRTLHDYAKPQKPRRPSPPAQKWLKRCGRAGAASG